MTAARAQSIKARLLTRARERGEEFELFLVRYVAERFLYRLGVSELRDDCALKGAALLRLWIDDPYRATRDVDLLARGANDAEHIRGIMTSICAIDCPDDGLQFDSRTLTLHPLRGQIYAGQQARMFATLGSSRIRLQVDFGFGDVVIPAPESSEYPTLLPDMPPPNIRTYPRVAVIAEKFEAMVTLGLDNSRMKDFHDVWALSETFEFDAAELRRAVAACFERRRTPWSDAVPIVLTSRFYTDAHVQARWSSYCNKASRTPPPADFATVGARVRDFLGTIRDQIISSRADEHRWSPDEHRWVRRP